MGLGLGYGIRVTSRAGAPETTMRWTGCTPRVPQRRPEPRGLRRPAMRTTDRRRRCVEDAKNESQSTFRDEEQGNRWRLRAGTTRSEREEGD
jgi:hypothetical protein